jgi:hypothetical protein
MAGVAGPIGIAIAAVGALAGVINSLVSESLEKFGELNKSIAKTGDLTDEQVVRMSAKVNMLSEVFGEQNDRIVLAAQQMAKGFGISFSKALEQVEIGFKNGANSSNELIDSIKEYSVLAKEAGMDAEQYRKLLEVQAQEGVYADKLADSLKEANIKLGEFKKGTKDALLNAFGKPFTDEVEKGVKSGSMTTFEAMQKISTKAIEVGLNTQQLSTLVADVFGGMGEDIGRSKVIDIYANFEDKTVELTGSAKKAQEAMEKQMQSVEALGVAQSRLTMTIAPLQQELGTFFNELKTQSVDTLNAFLETYGEDIVKVFKDVMKFAGEVADIYGEVYGEIFETVKEIGTDIASIFEGIGGSAEGSLSLIKGAVTLISTPLKALVTLISRAVSVVEAGTKKIIDLGAAAGIEYFKQIKSERQLALAARARAEFEAQAMSDKEKMQSFLRQEAVGEYDLQFNLNKVKRISFEEQQAFWAKTKKFQAQILKGKENITEEDRKQAELRALKSAAGLFRDDYFKKIKAEAKVTTQSLLTAEAIKKKAAKDKEKRDKARAKKSKKTAKELIKETSLLVKNSTKEMEDMYRKTFTPFDAALLQYDLIIKKEKELEALQESGANITTIQKEADELKHINSLHTETLNLLSAQQMSVFQLRTAFKGIKEDDSTPPKKEGEETPEEKAKRLADEAAAIRGATVEVTQMASDAIFEINASRIDALEAKRMASIDRMFNREVEQARGNSVLIEQAEAKRIKRQEALEAELNKKRKRQAIAQATINGALAITKILAEVPKFDFGVATAIQVGLAASSTAAQIATISSQQFAKGGVINGPSHAQGGVPVYGAGGKFAEVEGGEAIINKRSTTMFKPILSAINTAGGGKKFASGGVMPSMERIASNAGFDIGAETNLVGQAIAKLTDRQQVVVLDTFQEEQDKLNNYNKTRVQ